MQVMLLPSDPLDSRNIMLEGQPIFGHLMLNAHVSIYVYLCC
jgi:hypothetical protein